MTVKEIYNELQMIDEFHANFNPTCDSKSRMKELTYKLNTMQCG